MALAMLMEWPDMDERAYLALVQALDLGNTMFAGAILHLAGPADGGWRAVDVWADQEAFDRFKTEKLEPAMTNSGTPVPRVQTWTVHSLATPQGPLAPQR